MRKIGCILSSIIILILLILPISASALSASGSLSGPSKVYANSTFAVYFRINSNAKYYGVEGDFSFDDAQLKLISVKKATTENWGVTFNGKKVFAEDAYQSSNMTGSKSLFKATFKVKSLGVGQKIRIGLVAIVTDGEGVQVSSAFNTTVVKPPVTTTKKPVTTTKTPISEEQTSAEEVNSVEISTIKIEGTQLSPKFNPKQKEYIVWLPYEIDKLNIDALPLDKKAKVEIEGNNNFQAGKENIVNITCIAQNEEKLVYKIKAMRAPLNGVYESATKKVISNNVDTHKRKIPLWAAIALGGIGGLLLGLILCSIVSLIKKRRNNVPHDDDDNNNNLSSSADIDLFNDEDEYTTDGFVSISNFESKFKDIYFPEKEEKSSLSQNTETVDKQQKQRMYIEPNFNNIQSPTQNDESDSSIIKQAQKIAQQSQVPVQPPVNKPVEQKNEKPVQPPIDMLIQTQEQEQKPVRPPVNKPVEQKNEKPVQSPIDMLIQTQEQEQKPVQPKTELKSSTMIEAGEITEDIKLDIFSEQSNKENVNTEVDKMKLPYIAAGTKPKEKKIKKPSTSNQTKRLPRNPFELSADD